MTRGSPIHHNPDPVPAPIGGYSQGVETQGAGVTLFEKAPTVGGRAATRESKGFLFNPGGHALYTGGAASEVFRELGVVYGHGVPKDTFVLHEGKISPFSADPLGLLRTALLNAGDKLALFRLFVAVGANSPACCPR